MSSSRAVSLEQLVALNDEIAALVRTGVPLELGLREMGTEAGGATGAISEALADRMRAGGSLPEALRAEERRIPPIYRTIVEAGLRSGRLSAALETVSDFARELVELRRQVGMALVYPLIVGGLAYGLFLVFLVNLLDEFRRTYAEFRLPLHGSLRAMVWLADRVGSWWWIPPAAVLGLMAVWAATGSAHLLGFTGSYRTLRWIPGIGRIGRYYRYANFADLLSLLLEHQVPLAEALRLSGEATGDRELKSAAGAVAGAVEQARDVADVARGPSEPSLFWPMVVWVGALPCVLLTGYLRGVVPEDMRGLLTSLCIGLASAWLAFWPVMWLGWLVRELLPRRGTFPPLLHWVLGQASRGANPVRLLRHASAFYRRRAANVTRWFKLFFPIFASVVIGGGITAIYVYTLFGPLIGLWSDLGIE